MGASTDDARRAHVVGEMQGRASDATYAHLAFIRLTSTGAMRRLVEEAGADAPDR